MAISVGQVKGNPKEAAEMIACLERENEQMRAAGMAIIKADDEFRASLGPHWEGDPVSDACEAARGLFCDVKQAQGGKDG